MERGIRLTSICPHEPRHNAVSERSFGTIFRHVRPALRSVPGSFWSWAALAAVDVMNRTVIVRDTGKTPWELAFCRKPSISHLRTLFCRCYLKVPPPDLPPGSKVADQGVPAVHLGLSGSGYLVYVPKWNSIRSSANVTFDETHMPGLATTDRASEGERPNQGQCERNDRGECDDDDDDDEPMHKDKPAEPTIAQRLSLSLIHI